MVCPNCGNKLPDEPVERCKNCGANVSVLYTLDEFRTPSAGGDPAKVPENTDTEHAENEGAGEGTAPVQKKRRNKVLIIILSIVVIGVIIFAGFSYWLYHHSLGKLPDPEYFLGVEADKKSSIGNYTLSYTFYTTQDPIDAVEDFCSLLLDKSEYKVVYEGCEEEDDNLMFYFSYDGWSSAADGNYFVRVFVGYYEDENMVQILYSASNIDDVIEIVEDEDVWDGELLHAEAYDDAGIAMETKEGEKAEAKPDSSDVDDGGDSDDSGTAESAETGSGSRTLLVEPLTNTAVSGTYPDASSNQIQSPDGFAGTALSFGGASTSGTNQVYKLTGSSDDYDIVKEYVSLLTGGNMNLELVNSYEKTMSNTYFSYAIDYTGTAKVDGQNTQQFVDEVSCDINLWGTIDGKKLTVWVYIPSSMEVTDFGWRYGGGVEDVDPAGDSVYAGLYLLADGTFETSDGRLSTSLGQADIFMDGTEIVSDVEYVMDGTKEALKVYNFYRTESVYFTVPYHQLLTGDIYTYDDLRGDHDTKESSNWGPEGFNMGTAFAVLHNGNWRYPLYENSQIEDVTVRVMYYEEDSVAVFYCYVLLTTSPYEIEFLAAVNLDAAENGTGAETIAASSDSGDTTCWSCFGDGDCSACGGKGYKVRSRGGEQTEVICASCVGSGVCPICGGDGKL